MKSKNFFLLMMASTCIFASCSNDDIDNTDTKSSTIETGSYRSSNEVSDAVKQQEMKEFTKVLSKAISSNEMLREFLKKQTLKQFDKNYDVLYYPIRNEKISNGLTFRDILVNNSSEEEIAKIENDLPLLNILIPKIPFLNVYPENLDTKDNELPVAIENQNNGTDIYIAGEKVDEFKANEFPGFNVVVVNQNTRVEASRNALTTRSGNSNEWTYTFKSENFRNNDNGTRAYTSQNFDHSVAPSYLYKKAEEAFNCGFNKNDNSINQVAYQRDHIYYGMTPSKTSGMLNRSVTEYLSYMEVDPKCYFTISDQQTGKLISDDPHIKNTSVSRKKRGYSDDELLQRMWTQGSYNFIVEVSTSLSTEPEKLAIPVYPNEIWNFNIEVRFRYGSFWRHNKHTYTINPKDFTAKRYYFNPSNVTFGKWDIKNEGLTRYISIYEGDDGNVETSDTFTETITHVSSTSFSGDIKLSVGLKPAKDKDTIGGGVSGKADHSDTTTTTHTMTIKRKEDDDLLAYKVPVYFYDPIVDSEVVVNGKKTYKYHEYNSGVITFGIDVR